MSRLERPTTESRNPAKRFLEWKSEDKCFSYYDKEKKKNVSVDLPFKFLFLEHYHTVKGWHDPSFSGIYANEVFLIGSEEMTVKSFKGGEIASGLYKDIKPTVNSAGGDYHRSIYGMTEQGEIINISVKGAVVGGIKKEKAVDKKDHKGYSDFIKENESKTDFHWIEIKGIHEGKSGRVTYSIPDFSIGDKISEEVDKMANEAASELQKYIKSYTKKESAFDGERPNSEVDKYNEKTEAELADELDF